MWFPQADSELDTSSLREALGQRLPDYMVPGVVVTLDALPLNANGKVDRKALPAPDLASSTQYEPPQGEVEEALAETWSDVLGMDQVGRHDNFFELGGTRYLRCKWRHAFKLICKLSSNYPRCLGNHCCATWQSVLPR